MEVRVTNAQREAPVKTAEIARLARRAIRRLGIRTPGRLSIICISRRRMRALNRRFLHHDHPTDVLSFRYDGEPTEPRRAESRAIPLASLAKTSSRGSRGIVGEILIAPSQARVYATRHGIPYREELARYVVHGLLHWSGHLDGTRAEQRRMRAMEDYLLVHCVQ